MYKSIAISALCLASALAFPYELNGDEVGEEFVLVPVSRLRRQTSVDISKSGAGGSRVTLGHSGTIYRNGNHRLDGSAFASKQFRPAGPLTTGGQLSYTHVPSGSGLSAGMSNTRGFGRDVGAQGTYNIYRDNRNSLSATGQYSRHFGGPYGTGRPNYGVGLQYQYGF